MSSDQERSPDYDAATEAAEIDSELRELQSFVLVETGHMPTVGAVAALRTRIRKALLPPGSGDTP